MDNFGTRNDWNCDHSLTPPTLFVLQVLSAYKSLKMDEQVKFLIEKVEEFYRVEESDAQSNG